MGTVEASRRALLLEPQYSARSCHAWTGEAWDARRLLHTGVRLVLERSGSGEP